MRVTCGTVQEWLENLEHYGRGAVFGHCVWVDVSRRGIDTSDLRHCVKMAVAVQATAVVELGGEGQMLLMVGEDCGMDYRDVSQELEGSLRAESLVQQIRKWCGSDIKVLPGTVGE